MFSLIVITFLLASSGWSERLHNQIYSSIEGGAACFRRLNGTHQAGCGSSTENGAVGAVHWIWESEDARWVAGGGGGGAPYVTVVSSELFEQVIETLIQSSDNVAGVIIYDNDTHIPLHFSSDSHCPNELSSGPGSQCGPSPLENVWNPHGSGLMRRDIPFPLLYLPATRMEEVNKLHDCYLKFNDWDRDSQGGRVLCSVQLSAFMFAAVNSEVCIRRSGGAQITSTKQCDPVGDRNIHSTLFKRSPEVKESNRSVILVTARMDAASLFDGISPGAASSAVGLVTLLTAASTLSDLFPPEGASSYSNNVMWSLLSGESFDYIGSQRIAYDMSRGAWPAEAPLLPQSVALHVELGQLGGALAQETAGQWALTAFAPNYNSPEDEQIQTFVSTLKESESKLVITQELTSNLPPSSLHSFRRILGETPAKGGLPELLLVDHGLSFTNQHYQSIFDDKRNVKFVYANVTLDNGKFVDTATMIAAGHLTDNSMQVKISRFANAVARTLYHKVTGEAYNGNNAASAHMVDELLHCFLESANCRMFSAADFGPTEGSTKVELPNEPYPLYSGVHLHNNQVTQTVGMLLALLTGRVNTTILDNCLRDDQEYSYFWLNGWDNTGVCIQSTVNYTDALSPAFMQPDYDWSSGKYSTWTESVWRGVWARMFIAPSGRGARLAATLGAISTLLVAVLTYWLHKHSDVIFDKPNVSLTIDADPSATGILRTVNC